MTGRPVTATGFSGTVACEVLEVTAPKRLAISWEDAAAGTGPVLRALGKVVG